LSLLLTNWSARLGTHIYLQGSAPAQGANAGSGIVSSGLVWLIGR